MISSQLSPGKSLNRDGYCIIPNVISPEAVDKLIRAIEEGFPKNAADIAAGTRQLAAFIPAVAELAASAPITALLETLGSPGAFLVRSIYFDKQPGANWSVAWHQDITIAVREKRDMPGFRAWSVKAGLAHVQPPAPILERMVTLRVHLDNCDAGNGALKVIPGSHRFGVLDAGQIRLKRQMASEVVCAIGKGGIVALRPLLLHASSQAIRPVHRRVIHLEYAAEKLPGGLDWVTSGP